MYKIKKFFTYKGKNIWKVEHEGKLLFTTRTRQLARDRVKYLKENPNQNAWIILEAGNNDKDRITKWLDDNKLEYFEDHVIFVPALTVEQNNDLRQLSGWF